MGNLLKRANFQLVKMKLIKDIFRNVGAFIKIIMNV